jgi:hypothetical protein
MTARQHRELAAKFYVRPSYMIGHVRDWIDTGEDVARAVDDDIKDLAIQFAECERRAVMSAVEYYEGGASPTFKENRANEILGWVP